MYSLYLLLLGEGIIDVEVSQTPHMFKCGGERDEAKRGNFK